MYLPSANQISLTSLDGTNVLQLKNYLVGSTGVYKQQVAIASGINTNTNPSFVVQGQSSSNIAYYSTSTADVEFYTRNGNTPYVVSQLTVMNTGYNASLTTSCTVGAMFYSISNGNTFTTFPTGSFQQFPSVAVYAQCDGQVGNNNGTGFYCVAQPVYYPSRAYYARVANGVTSGNGYGYTVDLGPHPFGSGSYGLVTRIVSGQDGSYSNVTGWLHRDETSSGSTYAAKFERGGNSVGSITLSTSATTYSTSSDPRQKNVTGAITPDDAKSFVMALQPKKGTWKADGSYFQGFLSSDYELVDPKAVNGVAGATEARGKVIDGKGQITIDDVVQPTPEGLPEGGRWEQTHIKELYQTLEYGSAAWCANMTAHAQYLQSTIDQLIGRISALENK
jgi:hypothetical protein